MHMCVILQKLHVLIYYVTEVSLEVYGLDMRKHVYAVRSFTLSIALYFVIEHH